jgi:hypothetical protein
MALVSHPKPEELTAFAQGKLPAADSAAVEEHLLGCDSCVQFLEAQPDDPLLRLARLQTLPVGAAAPPSGPVTFPESETHTVSLPNPGAAGGAGDRPSFLGTGPAGEVPPLLAGHPRYRVLRLLGQGGMGAVFLAEHRVLRRLVALKVIKQVYTADPAAVERFRREARAAAQLQHPNIVAAHDADPVGDTHFLVMEYVAGVTLAQLLRERGPLPVAQACEYARQAALGLQHAHERGLVHRDVKPENLMLAADGTVKVLDFGLAALNAERGPDALTSLNGLMGTPDYMAPEQAEDPRQADTRADVYSLGCTLYQLLTGQVPYPAPTPVLKVLAHREKPLPSVRAARREVPAELEAVLNRLLARRPAARPQTPGAAAAALAPFAAGAGGRRRRGRRLRAVALLGLLAALAAVGSLLLLNDPGEPSTPPRAGKDDQPRGRPPQAEGPPDELRLRLPESGPQPPAVLHWGSLYRPISVQECLRRGVAALGRTEEFILAETVGHAVFGHNEKTAAVIFTTPAKGSVCMYVVVTGRDVKETGRLWHTLLTRVCDGPSPAEVPPWIATPAAGRRSQAPVQRLTSERCRLGFPRFADAASAALERQGFRAEINKERDAVLGYRYDSSAIVLYDPRGDPEPYLSVLVSAFNGAEAERLRKAIRDELMTGKAPAGRASSREVWRSPRGTT